MKCFILVKFESINFTYSAAWSNPVSKGQSGQSYSHSQHHQQFDGSGLLSEAGQILIPDTQQLLLTIRMSHELKGTDVAENSDKKGNKREQDGQVNILIAVIVNVQ